ncbi:MAG TPA: methylated-DNA--[protein]-cysteine S-methyltransferase [Nitrososphaera sp.]|nr:methylated-DNA--[protein]-cysteine S-methyltransferase [Nitrososphaera sp.]
MTPKEYARARRAKRVRSELGSSDIVAGAIYGTGYRSNRRSYEISNYVLEMTPSSCRDGGAGTEIRFAMRECSLGSMLVAHSVRGVYAILLGDDPDELALGLQDRFPRADPVGGDTGFEWLVAKVVGFVEAPTLELNLPLEIRGTAFHQRLWQALLKIRVGSTASHADFANHIGAPRSVRAVAHACTANVLAVAILWHHVVRSEGSLSSYRGGIERKRVLLEKEII